uniref:NADH dehydrogenase subunit 6 n=1 Tax=Malcus inconspicuus TaxID=498929 RepID=B7SMG3_9HEMI|nr:NADH dehydrogenase subunit 6 [Malcus inconspicuus]ABZ02057.1 NADH dehydrogenase subunit 6 [Malcus inconspicuus]
MMTLIVPLSMLFLFVKHPLSMGITIILQTIIIALSIGEMMNSFWFSYIIIIIMLSGMMVLFIYMASIASNEKLKFSNKMTFLIMMTLIMSNNNSTYWMELNNNWINISMNMLFNSITMMITLIMVNYLFFCMMIISKIVNIKEGPLRMKI